MSGDINLYIETDAERNAVDGYLECLLRTSIETKITCQQVRGNSMILTASQAEAVKEPKLRMTFDRELGQLPCRQNTYVFRVTY